MHQVSPCGWWFRGSLVPLASVPGNESIAQALRGHAARDRPAIVTKACAPRRAWLRPKREVGGQGGSSTGSPSALLPFFGLEGSPVIIDYRKKGTLILTSLLEDLVKAMLTPRVHRLLVTSRGWTILLVFVWPINSGSESARNSKEPEGTINIFWNPKKPKMSQLPPPSCTDPPLGLPGTDGIPKASSHGVHLSATKSLKTPQNAH